MLKAAHCLVHANHQPGMSVDFTSQHTFVKRHLANVSAVSVRSNVDNWRKSAAVAQNTTAECVDTLMRIAFDDQIAIPLLLFGVGFR